MPCPRNRGKFSLQEVSGKQKLEMYKGKLLWGIETIE